MHRGGEADAHRAHAALGERERGALVQDPAAGSGKRFAHVPLRGELPRLQARHSGGDGQRPVGPRQHVAQRLDGGAVRGDGGVEVAAEGDVMAEREMHDPVALRRRGAEHIEIADVATADLGARGRDGRGARVGAGEADDLMIGCEEILDDGGADPARRAGDEYAHELPPMSVTDITLA